MFYKTKIITATSAATLESDLNDFLKDTLSVSKDDESKLVDVIYSVAAAYDIDTPALQLTYSAMVLYKDYSNRPKGSISAVPVFQNQ